MLQEVEIEALVLDPEVNIRGDVDETTVLRYMDVFDVLPPIRVVHTPDGLVLCDGFHRVECALRLGRLKLQAEVTKGTHEDAIRIATLSNLGHGLPLQQNEWEYAAWRLVRRLGMSTEQAGKELGCARSTVLTAVRAFEMRQKLGRPLTRQVAAELAKVPEDKQVAVADLVGHQPWKQVRALVQQVNAMPEMTVAEVAQQAAPHLAEMANGLRHKRLVDGMLQTARHLDALGVTPARAAAQVTDPVMYDRWLQQTEQVAAWFTELHRELQDRHRLKAVK